MEREPISNKREVDKIIYWVGSPGQSRTKKARFSKCRRDKGTESGRVLVKIEAGQDGSTRTRSRQISKED